MAAHAKLTKKLAQELCAEIAEGRSLRSICAREDMPAKSSVFNWLADESNEWFREMYELARQFQADGWADEVIDIADESSGDYVEVDGRLVFNAEAVARARLRIDARKWHAGKIRPSKYGDKTQHEHSGKDGAPLVPVLNVSVGTPPAPDGD